MFIVYSTTRPRRSDTRFIVKQKWLQLLNNGPTMGSSSGVITYADTLPRYYDTRLIALQKILQEANS